MSAADAARNLAKALRGAHWLLSVGIGQDSGKETIFLYVKKNPPKDVPALKAVPHEFPVVVRKTGPLKPAAVK
jgi:hypothetical protein